ncbi:cytochrome c biogenesis heme-transporting ATPase CcmA [Thiorhodovibrio frisius]|uniref:Heme ABC exporter, ATP-binding protein CcmA n=1 Tax=Thiorhodovibrio frisius TaxID=631362 RepID=H8Z7Q9_9GAMM|nr:cytochrome c biogenesis heme-transporting ATPase CcmA [Thiorhodovibrio frisius]EIC19912.1 heme ABC exporter, ATP-binding protein CcmA [Thiorhodovibrio frisius]WPL20640.1 Cytochrome c biogenesis ATP-binding export protein CcmA [Thiorhodovibrio frisius]
MLEVSALSCRRGERCLFSALDLQLAPGQLLHLQGSNGSGKTTLLRALCGLLHPEAGQIRWRGEPIERLAEDYYRDLLYLGHLNGIKGDLTGLENLRIACRLVGRRASDQAIGEALARIGLGGFEDLPCRMLSQGQKKRVALARLLLSKAPLWILDEPFAALDVGAVALLDELIRAHVEAGGLAVLTTHQALTLAVGQRLDLNLDAAAPRVIPAGAATDIPSASRTEPSC